VQNIKKTYQRRSSESVKAVSAPRTTKKAQTNIISGPTTDGKSGLGPKQMSNTSPRGKPTYQTTQDPARWREKTKTYIKSSQLHEYPSRVKSRPAQQPTAQRRSRAGIARVRGRQGCGRSPTTAKQAQLARADSYRLTHVGSARECLGSTYLGGGWTH
jgi:hypothetical protein